MSLPRQMQSYYKPKTRRYLPWHQFFEEGDIQCSSRSKQLEFQEHDLIKTRRHFACHIGGCNASFTSLPEFEMHYNSAHWNVCSSCKQWFPNHHLLDIHFQEWHDPFFDVMKFKEKMFQCLIESCDCKFMKEEDRKVHLIQVHHYPPDYQFDKPINDKPDTRSTEGGITQQLQNDRAEAKQQRSFPKEICFGQGSSKCFHLTDQNEDS